MANLVTLLLLLLVWLAALIVCFREQLWTKGLRSRSAVGLLAMIWLGLFCADFLQEKATLVRVLCSVPVVWLLAGPLVASAGWFGKASSTLAGNDSLMGIARAVADGLLAVVVLLLVTLLLKAVSSWAPMAGWFTPFAWHAEESLLTTLALTGFYLGFATLEEVLFRGVLLRWIGWEARHSRHALLVAVMLSSLAFGFAHGLNAAKFIQTVIMGFVFAWLSIRHGLWAACLTHGVLNVTMAVGL